MSIHTDIITARANVNKARRELLRLLTVAVVLRDGSLCNYCGVPTLLSSSSGPLQRTVDHVIPVSFGGKDELSNLVLCCRSCNSRKSNQVSLSQLCPSCQGGAASRCGEGR